MLSRRAVAYCSRGTASLGSRFTRRTVVLSSSAFHSTADASNKIDVDYYQKQISSHEKGDANSKKKPSIYDVHKQQQQRKDVRAAFIVTPPTKDRRDWDHGDYRRYRLFKQQQQQEQQEQGMGPSGRRKWQHNDDPLEQQPAGRGAANLRPQGTRQREGSTRRSRDVVAASRPHPVGRGAGQIKDEAGRRFRQPYSSSREEGGFASGNRDRMIPRNGEVDPEATDRALRRRGQQAREHGGELFAKYTKQPARRQQSRQGGEPRGRHRGSASDEERLRAEQLIRQSTPIIMPDDDDGDDYDKEYTESVEEVPIKVKGPATREPKTAQKATFPPDKLSAYISCHEGLEPFLKEELDWLGIEHKMHKNYGAHLLKPTVEDLMKCHLFLGTASNIFLRCGEPFAARALGELRRKVQAMPWGNILDLQDDQPPRFKVKVKSSKSRLLHTTAIRDQLLSGIYASLGFEDLAEKAKDPKKKKKDEEHKEEGADKNVEDETVVRLTIHFFRDKAQIAIDTSATPIHQRAYRLVSGKAPLREDLAFAFLFSAGWRPVYALSNHRQRMMEKPQYTSFIDPFCGSGTLAIEAAAMASGLPPGRLRPAPLAGTTLYDPKGWERLVMKAMQRSAAIDSSDINVCASDRDKGAVKNTETNAQRAGVLGLIETQECAFSAHPWLEKPADAPENLLLAANLPFGRRLKVPLHKRNHKKNPLLPMYQSVATHLDSFADSRKHFTAIFLTDEPELFKVVGCKQKFDTALSTKHGGIPVSGVLVKAGEADDKSAKKKETGDDPDKDEQLVL